MRTAYRLLRPAGAVIVRAGGGAMNPGGLLEQAMHDIFGPGHVGRVNDQWGVTLNIRAQK